MSVGASPAGMTTVVLPSDSLGAVMKVRRFEPGVEVIFERERFGYRR